MIIKAGGKTKISNGSYNYNCRNTIIKILIPHDNYTLTLLRNSNYIKDLGLISWGDGTSGDLNNLYVHTYNKAGIYTIQGHFVFGLGFEPTNSVKEVLLEVIQLSDKCANLSKAFYECKKLKRIDLNGFDMDKVNNKTDMVKGCNKLDKRSLDI